MAHGEHSFELHATAEAAHATLGAAAFRLATAPAEWNLTLEAGPEAFAPGAAFRWRTRRSGVTQRFVTEVVAADPPRRWVERQTSGALRHFEHRVEIAACGFGRVRIVDAIDFEPPGGLLGLVATEARLRADFEAAFRLRDAELARRFPGPAGDVGGLILCGGASRRMGQPKAWLPYAGESLLARAVRHLAPRVAPVVVVAAAGQALPELPPETQLACDANPDRGPLEGLAAGLRAVAGRVDYVYATSCDAPHLAQGWISRLRELIGDAQVCVPLVAGTRRPLAALYRVDLLPTVLRLLNENQLRLGSLADAAATRFASEADLADVDPTFATLDNLNDPAAYAAALARLTGSCQ